MKVAYQFQVFRGKNGLCALEADWHLLESEVQPIRFIHYYGWYKSRIENTETQPESVFFILARNSDKPLAIFPVFQKVTTRFGITLQTIEIYWRNDMGISDFLFAKIDDNKGLLAQLILYIKNSELIEWDLFNLQDTLEDSCAYYALKAVSLPRSVSILHHYSKFIRCDADFETVMGRLAGHFRRNVRRQTKKLSEQGELSYEFVSDPTELDMAFGMFLDVEASSWKGEKGTNSAIRLQQNLINFYKSIMSSFSGRGSCVINLLLLDGKCIAAQFSLIIGDTLYLLKIGYSEEYQSLGPGNVLLCELIRRCCENQNIKNISFITGAEWNDNWSPSVLNVYENLVFNATLRGYTVCALEKLKDMGRHVKHRIQSYQRNSQFVTNRT